MILGTHNLQTFKHNTLVNELLLMQFYLFNIPPNMHHRKLQKLCVQSQKTRKLCTFSTSPAAVLRPTFIRKLCNCRAL